MPRTIDEVYDKCVDIEKHVLKTNGKVMLNRWIATSALTIAVFLSAALIYGQVVV